MVQAAALPDASALTDPVLERVRGFYEENHDSIERARHARRYFYGYMSRVLRARIPPGQRVLDVGCGTGHLLSELQPSFGVGIDLSARAVAAARAAYSGRPLHFFEGDGGDPRLLAQVDGPFDAVVMVNVVTHLTDVQRTLESLAHVCHARTRVFIYSYSRLWQPVLRLAELLRLKHRPPPDAWLPPEEVKNMLHLADYEVVRHDYQVLWPAHVPLVSDLLNRYVGRLPGVEWLSLMYGIVARPAPHRLPGRRASRPSVSVVIPCRN